MSSKASPPVRIRDSDLCTTRTVGTNLSTPMMTLFNRSLGSAPPEPRIAHESTCRVPYEVVETIIAHLARDPDALRTCSLICRSWHTATVPHLYYTLTLKGNGPDAIRGKPRSLPWLHGQGLLPFVKEVQVWGFGCWFVPQAFGRRSLHYFSALANVHTLELHDIEIYRFIPGIERRFGHFSPTLRSITLSRPCGTPRQLSHFLSLFPNLDDVEIWKHSTSPTSDSIFDTQPISTPKLRGRLTLLDFRWVNTWTYLIVSCGLRFRHMDLRESAKCAPILLEACAGTLETLRFNATDSESSYSHSYKDST